MSRVFHDLFKFLFRKLAVDQVPLKVLLEVAEYPVDHEQPFACIYGVIRRVLPLAEDRCLRLLEELLHQRGFPYLLGLLG